MSGSSGTDIARYATTIIKIYGKSEAPRVAADLCRAFVLIGDLEKSLTWEKVRRTVAAIAAEADGAGFAEDTEAT